MSDHAANAIRASAPTQDAFISCMTAALSRVGRFEIWELGGLFTVQADPDAHVVSGVDLAAALAEVALALSRTDVERPLIITDADRTKAVATAAHCLALGRSFGVYWSSRQWTLEALDANLDERSVADGTLADALSALEGLLSEIDPVLS